MKVIYVFKRIINLDYSRMFKIIKDISKKTNKNFLIVFCDIVYCGIKYQAGYSDYMLFEMYKMNKSERETIVTRGINNSFIRFFNNKKFNDYFRLKPNFNETFNEYLKRDWLLLSNISDLKKFIKKNPIFIVKPVDGMCGKNIEKIDSTKKDVQTLYKYLIDNNLTLLEEIIEQHSELNLLHPHSINTIRIITIRNGDLSAVLAIYFRIGNGKVVDNFNSGGMVVPVNREKGIVEFPALDKAGHLYHKHPITNTDIVGFEIPLFKECLALVEKAALVVSETRMVGWDVAITPNGPVLVEGNEFPGHDIYQLPPHRSGNIGLLPDFISALNKINIDYKKMKWKLHFYLVNSSSLTLTSLDIPDSCIVIP